MTEPTNELATQKPKVAIQKRDESMEPQTFGEVMALCERLARSELVPSCFRGKPADIFIAFKISKSLGIDGIQGIQNIAVINGRPSIYGELGTALLLREGFKVEMNTIEERKAKKLAWCRITRPDGASQEATFGVDDAQMAGLWAKPGPWKNTPWDMLGWKAFWRAAKFIASDALHNMMGAEEAQDIPPENPTSRRLQPDAPQLPPAEPAAAAQTSLEPPPEIHDAELLDERPPAAPKEPRQEPTEQQLIGDSIRGLASEATSEPELAAPTNLVKMKLTDADEIKRCLDAIEAKRAALKKGGHR